MRKLIAAMNMTLDGFCDHTAMIADDELHKHYNVGCKNARLATRSLKEEVLELKQQTGQNIFAGSPSIIVALTQLDLIDEYQICVQPTIIGSGLRLFGEINDRINLKLIKTKIFGAGSIKLYYAPVK